MLSYSRSDIWPFLWVEYAQIYPSIIQVAAFPPFLGLYKILMIITMAFLLHKCVISSSSFHKSPVVIFGKFVLILNLQLLVKLTYSNLRLPSALENIVFNFCFGNCKDFFHFPPLLWCLFNVHCACFHIYFFYINWKSYLSVSLTLFSFQIFMRDPSIKAKSIALLLSQA